MTLMKASYIHAVMHMRAIYARINANMTVSRAPQKKTNSVKRVSSKMPQTPAGFF